MTLSKTRNTDGSVAGGELALARVPPRLRIERIGEFWSYPEGRTTFAELVIDCEEIGHRVKPRLSGFDLVRFTDADLMRPDGPRATEP